MLRAQIRKNGEMCIFLDLVLFPINTWGWTVSQQLVLIFRYRCDSAIGSIVFIRFFIRMSSDPAASLPIVLERKTSTIVSLTSYICAAHALTNENNLRGLRLLDYHQENTLSVINDYFLLIKSPINSCFFFCRFKSVNWTSGSYKPRNVNKRIPPFTFIEPQDALKQT